ncbi:MAG: metallopeptidase family protein [Planctomycetaceae bacterium]|jgi:predicted Zn-dependent protease with MMP-like domain|nr:metallopeptidase family protein [Planctomycetaceae bacterium]
MNQRKRDFFDKQVEYVLNKLPESVTQLFDEIPLHVEDYPSKNIRKLKKIKYIDDLAGYFSGVPIGEQLHAQPHTPTTITIFRYGIFALATDKNGNFSLKELRRQIRITILHELGHYHGISEKEIKKIGYG